MTYTLNLNSDLFVGSGWSLTGSGEYSNCLSDGSDATYGSVNSSDSGSAGTLQMTLDPIPGTVASISAASIVLRCLTSSAKGSSEIAAQVWNSTGSTALTSLALVEPTTSFSTISTSVTLSDAVITDWRNAYLQIGSTADGLGHTLEVSEAYVVLTVMLGSGVTQQIVMPFGMFNSSQASVY